LSGEKNTEKNEKDSEYLDEDYDNEDNTDQEVEEG
jgi:hypothetical protein